MIRRTESEREAYTEGYIACYKQFCEYLLEAMKKMSIIVAAENAVIEASEVE